VFSKENAEYVCDFLECLTVPDGGMAGKPFRLMDWQRETLEQFYGETKENGLRKYEYLYLEIPKKNGKTGLAAGLGLYHTFADGERSGEVYAVAADRDNAGIVFKAALEMLEACPPLKKRARIVESQKKIIDLVSKTEFRVLSAEAYSKHGYKPSCVIFDELHAQPSRDLWDIMTFGAGAAREQPVWIVLTTAGNDPDRNSIGWEIHEKAANILAARRGEPGYIDNPVWLPVIYGYDGDDIYNEANWFAANPSLKYGYSVTIDKIRQEALDAQQSPATERLFRWLRLNQWIATKAEGWLPLDLWDATEDGDVADLIGRDCYMGMDLSSTTDLTSVVLVFPPADGKPWRTLFRCWIPEERMAEREKRDHVPFSGWVRAGLVTATSGNAVDYQRVYEDITRMRQQFRVLALGTDPWNSRMLTQQLMADGLEVVEIPQTMAGMSPAMKDMERLLRMGQMIHEKSAIARWCFGNVRIAIDGNENEKPMKNRSIDRIDITVAWIIAVAMARQKMSMIPNVYERRAPRYIEF
jgi:phage terminase large subunit-like protein